MPGVKRGNPEKWPDSIRRNYRQAMSGAWNDSRRHELHSRHPAPHLETEGLPVQAISLWYAAATARRSTMRPSRNVATSSTSADN